MARSSNCCLSFRFPLQCHTLDNKIRIHSKSGDCLYEDGHRLVLPPKRLTKIKFCCLSFRTPLVPVISFGETDVYDQVRNPEGSWLRSAQEFCRRVTGIAPVALLGRGLFQYSFGVLPQRRKVTTLGNVSAIWIWGVRPLRNAFVLEYHFYLRRGVPTAIISR